MSHSQFTTAAKAHRVVQLQQVVGPHECSTTFLANLYPDYHIHIKIS